MLLNAKLLKFTHSSLFYTDVNIWLVTFGFHLHNAIPGFPIPKFDLTQPSLEMRKSQLWDDLPVCIRVLLERKLDESQSEQLASVWSRAVLNSAIYLLLTTQRSLNMNSNEKKFITQANILFTMCFHFILINKIDLTNFFYFGW